MCTNATNARWKMSMSFEFAKRSVPWKCSLQWAHSLFFQQRSMASHTATGRFEWKMKIVCVQIFWVWVFSIWSMFINFWHENNESKVLLSHLVHWLKQMVIENLSNQTMEWNRVLWRFQQKRAIQRPNQSSKSSEIMISETLHCWRAWNFRNFMMAEWQDWTHSDKPSQVESCWNWCRRAVKITCPDGLKWSVMKMTKVSNSNGHEEWSKSNRCVSDSQAHNFESSEWIEDGDHWQRTKPQCWHCEWRRI